MLDEIVDDVEVEDALDKPDSDAASEAANDDLPTDPEELKRVALTERQGRIEAQREAKRHERTAERQKARADENEVAKKQWYSAWEKTQGQLDGGGKPENGNQEPASGSKNLQAALKDINLLDYVGGEDDKTGKPLPGTLELIEELDRRGVIVTPVRLEAILNQRDEQQRRATSLFGELTTKFPDLNDPDSELAQEATERAKRLIEDGMEAGAAYRVATAEAALDLRVEPKAKAKKPASERERLQRGQNPGPKNTGPSRPEAVPVSSKLQREAKRIGLSDKDMQAIARDVQQRNTRQRAQ